MPKFPVVSARQLSAFFKQEGVTQQRKKGSHIIFTKPGVSRPPVIPDSRELSFSVVTSNLKTAGISKTRFVAAMQNQKKNGSAGEPSDS